MQNEDLDRPTPSSLAKSPGPVVILLGFLAGGALRLAEFVFTRGVTVRARLTKDEDNKKSLEVDVRLNAFDEEGNVRQQDSRDRDYWRR